MASVRKSLKRKADRPRIAPIVALRVSPVQRISVKPDAHDRYDMKQQVERVIGTLGNRTVTRILGVSASHPARWKAGTEQIGPLHRERLSELDYLLDRLLQSLWPDEIGEWLTTPDVFLNGGRPIDVFVRHGSAPVIAALKAQMLGGFL